MILDQDRLEQRAHGRKEAEAIIGLIADCTLRFSGETVYALEAFWDEINEFVRQNMTPDPKAVAAAAAVSAMSDAEVREFRSRIMAFGKYAGQPMMDVPLTYLDWLLGEKDLFRRDVGRYLRNEKILEQLRDELPEGEF